MTMHELRQKIEVCGYERTPNYPQGAHVFYVYGDKSQRSLKLSKDELISELIAISSIDSKEEIEGYSLSQWDALCLVVRHELKEATNKEIEHLFKL